MSTGIFISGTDTEVGKTAVARLLVHEIKDRGLRCAAMKPVASGAMQYGQQLRNDDALQLQAASGLDLPYELVNPYVFKPAIAPHIAAAMANTEIRLEVIQSCYTQLQKQADFVVVEGVGGWLVPLGPTSDMADVVLMMGLPVIMVVGLRLGCLNHALLTQESIASHGGHLVGWVANGIAPELQNTEEVIGTLRARLRAPCLGVFGFCETDFETRFRGVLDMDVLSPLLKTRNF